MVMQMVSLPASIAKSDPPHFGQKPRFVWGDDGYCAGFPLVNRTESMGKSTHATTGAPDHRWHMRQKQRCGDVGAPAAEYRMWPQRQPPVYVRIGVGVC